MKFNPYLSVMVATGVCLCAAPALSCTIIEAFIPVPIDCVGENTPFSTEKFPDWGLQLEAIETASDNDNIVSNEENFTKALGKDGGGSLKEQSGNKINKIAREMRLSARDAAQATKATTCGIGGVSGSYGSDKSAIEKRYTVYEGSGIGYSTSSTDDIGENQRVAINDMAVNGLSMASATAADVNSANGVCAKEGEEDKVLTPEQRADEMAKARTVQGMYEMMMIMDRAVYERSLKAASVEATTAGIQAMKVLSGVATTAKSETIGEAAE